MPVVPAYAGIQKNGTAEIYLDLLRRYYGYLLLFSCLSPENNKKVTLCGEMPNRTDQKILTKIRKERKLLVTFKSVYL